MIIKYRLIEMLNIYKNIGETPLECIYRFRDKNPKYRDKILGIAGRLDPMAEGVLLIMEGEENKKREKYLSFNKTYVFEMVFGIETDTYDTLGKVVLSNRPTCQTVEVKNKLKSDLKNYIGKIEQKYPPFSSKTVGGKPLFVWAREGKLDQINIPTKEVKIYSLDLIQTKVISNDSLFKKIEEDISKVKGDFRQKDILYKWRESLKKENRFLVAKIEADVSSGTYIRALVNRIGKDFGCGAVTLSIIRTKAGDYSIDRSLR